MRTALIVLGCLVFNNAFANSASVESANLLLWLGILTIFAIFAKSSAKIGQPVVLGQLIFGIILGIVVRYNLFNLSVMQNSSSIAFFAELGSIFLLLEIGLESSLSDIKNAGRYAIGVAIAGVILPFLCGYFIVVPFILGQHGTLVKIFFGSMLAVTSTGVSVSVFKDLGILKTKSCQVVLAASVIDDICGLILLSVTTGLVIDQSINIIPISLIILNVVGFFVFSTIFGLYILPIIIRIIQKINNHIDTAVLLIISFGLLMAYFAGKIGLAFIIGAFLAGLFLEPQLFKGFVGEKVKIATGEHHHQLENLIAPYGKIFTPIFFIYAGMQVDIVSLFNIDTLAVALAVSIVAIFGKLFSGIFLPKHINRWLVGLGMVPRGEIGLIFAISGLNLKIIDQNIFGIILLMIVITSVVTPILINYLVQKGKK